MEIKIRNKIITAKPIFNILFILVLIATMAQMIINVLTGRDLITEMIIFSICATGVCYYFSK